MTTDIKPLGSLPTDHAQYSHAAPPPRRRLLDCIFFSVLHYTCAHVCARTHVGPVRACARFTRVHEWRTFLRACTLRSDCIECFARIVRRVGAGVH